MYGFQAISAANGWIISFAGISIVFSGLVALSLFVSGLEKLLNLWDRRASILKMFKPASLVPEAAQVEISETTPAADALLDGGIVELTPQRMEVFDQFKMITARWGENFALPRLLDRAEELGVLNACSNLDVFLKLGLIVEGEGELRGFYRWRKDVEIVPIEETNETDPLGKEQYFL